jgi:hypothetical protein
MRDDLKRLCWSVIALCALLSLTPAVSAEVYTYVDAEGNRVFTDQPRRNAKKVDIAPTNRVAQPTNTPSRASRTKPAPSPIFRYQLLRILAPEPDSTIREIQGNLNVTVTNDPELQPGHLYQLLLDGLPYAAPTRSPVFPLTNIDRGTHQLSVEIVDGNGRVLERTPNQPFHLLRISLSQKRLAQPCKNADYGVRPECPMKDKPEEESNFFPFFR